MATALKVTDLCKTYITNKRQNNVLKNVNFQIEEGEMVAIMGPSGSGKSTLLYSVSGMDRATAGTVVLGDMEITNLSEKDLADARLKFMGFIFQQMHLVSNLTMFENVAVSGYLNKNKTAAEVKKRVEELLEQMGISHIKTHLPSQVSGGEQQRVSIARALVKKPSVILADEPTANLDSKNGLNIIELMQELNRTHNTTFIFSTHDKMVMEHCRRIIKIKDGKFID